MDADRDTAPAAADSIEDGGGKSTVPTVAFEGEGEGVGEGVGEDAGEEERLLVDHDEDADADVEGGGTNQTTNTTNTTTTTTSTSNAGNRRSLMASMVGGDPAFETGFGLTMLLFVLTAIM